MNTVLVPICICVVLPIAIVLILSLTKIKADNLRTQIIIRALEANQNVDTAKLLESMRKPEKTARDILYGRLLRGCIFTLIGISLEIISMVNSLSGGVESEDAIFVPMVFGAISLSIGISFLIVYFMSRNNMDSSDPSQTK